MENQVWDEVVPVQEGLVIWFSEFAMFALNTETWLNFLPLIHTPSNEATVLIGI
jgi:hypothetical protein